MSSLPGLLRRPARTDETGAGDSASRAGPGAGERSGLQITWYHAGLAALLLGTALAYLWDLSASGYANSFYAAAVQAGTESWKAMFFGSLDSSSFITVDKPPASLWVMAISGRIFGFDSASLLVPQALEGVAAVALLQGAVRRWFGAGAGLLAGLALAITPVAALMFRFDNPDALLVCLLVASAYCMTRAIERAGTRWIVAAGALIGLAFLAKMMQAFLVLPAFALVYLVAAPTRLRRRFAQVAAGGAAIVVSAGWWVAIVALWPVGSRPMIDGSPDNSILNLIVGYNGLDRIFGQSGPGGGGGGGGGANFSGATGPLRLFDDLMGGQASWLLPAALLALAVGLWQTRSAPRSDRTRAALLLWGGWLIVTGLVFSFGSGVIHTYYTVALAPAIAALVAIGGSLLWKARAAIAARIVLALGVAVTAVWAFALLDRSPRWEPWLRVLVLALAAWTVVGLLALPVVHRLGRWATALIVALALTAFLAAPMAYSLQTISTPHTGSIPSAGPESAGGGIGAAGPGGGTVPGGRGGFAGRPGQPGGGVPGGGPRGRRLFGPGGGSSPAGAARARGAGGAPPSGLGAGGSLLGQAPPAGGRRGLSGHGPGGGSGGMGQVSVSSALKKALTRGASDYRWVAAVSGSQTAASIELATGGEPVMAIGGFSGQGGNIGLATFKRYVAEGAIHYYLAASSAGAGGGPPGIGGSSTSSITIWVREHFKAVSIGGQPLYDLSDARD